MKIWIYLVQLVVNFSLLACTLSLFQPALVWAADPAGGLVQESASLDVVRATDGQKPTPSPNTATLYGSVRKRQATLDATDTTSPQAPVDLNVSKDGAKLEGENASSGSRDLFNLAVKKLAAGEALSSEEYRSLGVGCFGFDSDRTFFQNIAKVNRVYRDSPASRAGIHKGDRVIQNENDDEKKAHPEIPRWGVAFAQAGTHGDVVVLRHGHPVTLTLVRMNIEDIQEPDIRQLWEGVIRELGYPKEGNYEGLDLHHLQPVSAAKEAKGGVFSGTSIQNLQLSPNLGTDKL